MDGWDERLPVDVSLADLPHDVRELVAEPAFVRAIDLLRSPRTPEQLAGAMGLDPGAMEGLLAGLISAGLVEELPASPTTHARTTTYRLCTPLIALHSRERDSCAQVVSSAAAWLAALHAPHEADRDLEVRVVRVARPVSPSLDPDVLVAELRTAITAGASHTTGPAIATSDPGRPVEAELEVQIVVVRRGPDPDQSPTEP